jgi:hypothetical protein
MRPHEYGSSPNAQGAINFARDSYIENALPYYKDVIKKENNPPGIGKIKLLIRLSGPLCLMVGLGLAFFAFYSSVTKAADFGLQSILVDSTTGPVTGSAKYKFKASPAAQMQQFSIRGGEWGRSESIKLYLPDAKIMVPNSVVFVRNTGTEVLTASNNVDGFIPNVDIYVADTFYQSLSGNTSGVPNNTYIAAKDPSGKMAWFVAFLMDGAI